MSDTSKSEKAASLERRKVGMLIPPPILLVVIALSSAAVQWLCFGSFRISPWGVLVGSLLIIASLLGFASARRQFKIVGTPFRPISPSTAIVNAGPYRFSRNPMYVAMAGLLAGIGVLLGSYVFAAGVVVFLLVIHFGVVLREERYLDAELGEPYRQYKRSVRRWL